LLDVHITPRGDNSPHRCDGNCTWRTLAKCQDRDPAPFYRRPYTKALACCRECPVAECCLFEALVLEQEADQRHGAWGATTPTQRHHLAAQLHRRRISLAELLSSEQAHWAGLLRPRSLEAGRGHALSPEAAVA